MKTQTEIMDDMIQKEQWSVDYHTRELEEAKTRLRLLKEARRANETVFDPMKELEKLSLKRTEDCEFCDGKGEVILSCCTGEIVDSDIAMCPECHEHLGEETCENCEGTGQVEITTNDGPKILDPKWKK